MRVNATQGVVLGRTNFGEADRIIIVLTPDHGKLHLMAKGARKEKSKLAAGIELFSISNISFISGKRDMGTLVSSRLEQHFGNIVKDIKRTTFGYSILKLINTVTEENCERGYFDLAADGLVLLNNFANQQPLVEAWFHVRLLGLMGHTPNFITDTKGHKLQASQSYNFDDEHMAFFVQDHGVYGDKHIKLLRLLCTIPGKHIKNINGATEVVNDCATLLQRTIRLYVPSGAVKSANA